VQRSRNTSNKPMEGLSTMHNLSTPNDKIKAGRRVMLPEELLSRELRHAVAQLREAHKLIGDIRDEIQNGSGFEELTARCNAILEVTP
jgi:hypothetical protein